MNEQDYRCPKCHSFGMKSWGNKLKCLWKDCLYVGTYKQVEETKHPIRFWKFVKSLKKKKRINVT